VRAIPPPLINTLDQVRATNYAKTIKIDGHFAARHESVLARSAPPRAIPAGHGFGEGALLMPGSFSDATYRASSAGGCTLLEVPDVFFYQLLANDHTLLAALHLKLLHRESRLTALLAHPRARAAFVAFLLRVEKDEHALDAFESMHSYAQLQHSTGLQAAGRVVGASIIADFVVDRCARPVLLSHETRFKLLSRVPQKFGDLWPADLFEEAEEELDALIRKQYMPRFMDHPVFEEVLGMLGDYEAAALFPPERLESVAEDLVTALDGDLSVTCMGMAATKSTQFQGPRA